jgi:iron complex outermembrane receptor protein
MQVVPSQKITGKDVNGNNITAPADSDDFTSTDPLIPSQRIQHFKLAADNSFNIGRDRLTVTLGYQRNQRQEFGNVEDPGEKELYFDLNTFNYNLQYHFAERTIGKQPSA